MSKKNKKIEHNTKKIIPVGMNDAKISTDDRPIIGTNALTTCIGYFYIVKKKSCYRRSYSTR